MSEVGGSNLRLQTETGLSGSFIIFSPKKGADLKSKRRNVRGRITPRKRGPRFDRQPSAGGEERRAKSNLRPYRDPIRARTLMPYELRL